MVTLLQCEQKQKQNIVTMLSSWGEHLLAKLTPHWDLRHLFKIFIVTVILDGGHMDGKYIQVIGSFLGGGSFWHLGFGGFH